MTVLDTSDQVATSDAELPALDFVRPIPGFPGLNRYALVEIEPNCPLYRLVAVEDTSVSLVVAVAKVFFPDYEPSISEDDAALFPGAAPADLSCLVILNLEADDLLDAAANLMAPVVVDLERRRAAQIIVEGDWPLRAPLLDSLAQTSALAS